MKKNIKLYIIPLILYDILFITSLATNYFISSMLLTVFVQFFFYKDKKKTALYTIISIAWRVIIVFITFFSGTVSKIFYILSPEYGGDLGVASGVGMFAFIFYTNFFFIVTSIFIYVKNKKRV